MKRAKTILAWQLLTVGLSFLLCIVTVFINSNQSWIISVKIGNAVDVLMIFGFVLMVAWLTFAIGNYRGKIIFSRYLSMLIMMPLLIHTLLVSSMEKSIFAAEYWHWVYIALMSIILIVGVCLVDSAGSTEKNLRVAKN